MRICDIIKSSTKLPRGQKMKKFLFLIPLIALTACDKNDIPKCWNDESVEFLKGVYWQKDGVKWHVKNIVNAYEIPGMSDAPEKYRYCGFRGTLTNGKVIVGNYKVYKTIEETGSGVYSHVYFDTIQVDE